MYACKPPPTPLSAIVQVCVVASSAAHFLWCCFLDHRVPQSWTLLSLTQQLPLSVIQAPTLSVSGSDVIPEPGSVHREHAIVAANILRSFHCVMLTAQAKQVHTTAMKSQLCMILLGLCRAE